MSSFIGPSQMLLYERQFIIASFTERSRVTIQPTRVPALEKTLLVLLVTMAFS